MDSTTISLLVSAVVPKVVNLVVNTKFIPVWTKWVAAVLVSAVVGGLSTLVEGQWTAGEAATNLAVVMAASQVAYETFWKKHL